MKWITLILIGVGLIFAGIFGVVLFLNGNSNHSAASETSLFDNDQIPTNIKLVDQDNHLVDLSEFTGQPILINFWATWCTPCKDEIPLLISYSEKYPRLKIIGISSYESRATVEKFLENTPIPYLVLLDTEGKVADQFQIIGYPTSFLVDAEGKLRYTHLGQMDASQLDENLLLIGIMP